MKEQPFAPADLSMAVDDLAMLPYFPHESRASVITFLAKICPHKRALRWLVEEVVNHVRSWPGPSEIRGLLCTRFDAADGIDHWCTLAGYTAADYEARYIQAHEQRKSQEKIGGHIGEETRDMIRRLAEKADSSQLSDAI